MLRELMVNGQKLADATHTADVALYRGMAVLKTSGEAVLASGVTCENVYFVDTQEVLTGIDSLRGEVSAYDDLNDKIAIGGKLVLKSYSKGEAIATDQVTGTPAAGTYLMANTDGTVVAAVSTNVSNMMSGGAYTDVGSKTLYIVKFVDSHTVA